MQKPKLSIILPSIDPDTWLNLYNQIELSINGLPFEVIAVGPNLPIHLDLQNKLNFRYIREWGCPSRALMIGSIFAEGEYITWLPSDSLIFPNTLRECVELLNSKTKNDGLTVLYSEGPNFTGNQHLDPNYWIARTHKDLQLKWVQEGWKTAPIFMYNLEKFRELGGLDCSFYHVNMNCSSLAFKLQKQGGIMWSSPQRVFSSNWKPWVGHHGEIMRIAYETNDAPKFKQMWDSEQEPNLDWGLGSWQKAEAYWGLRYK